MTSISITRTQGPPIVITGDDITGEIQDTTFTVNAKPFQNGNDLRVFIEFITGGKTVLDVVYTGEEECETLNPLPVELVSFKGIATKSGIDLKWRTASERDNKQFEIERSADGYGFEKIGIVAGHGTSSVPIDYSFEDKNPLNGTNYYRLKQVDLDGKYEYSNVIVAESSREASARLVVAPNPCRNGDCTVSLGNSGVRSETLVELKDMAGRVVFTKTIAAGDASDLRLDELKQFKGLYLLTATNGSTVTNVRLMLE
ncbi:T9SS type A sorting domain-containing protein [Pontibacter ruber]|uniref:T9SS type A sorting domain-containing protein n=1 Tax=Pontibacter ruber TaxID=1343895 RepID=A0ABW5D4X4_9BACT|nr:T9SS type A sorting domain-containing protein [Pontibacter ruber]